MNEVERNTRSELVVKNEKTGETEIIDVYSGEVLQVLDKRNLSPNKFKFEYSTAMRICQEITKGRTLQEICRPPHFPPLEVVYMWLRRDQMFAYELEMARKQRAEYYHDMIADIAHNANQLSTKTEIEANRLGMDAYKWLAEKNDPNKFGTRINKEVNEKQQVTVRLIKTGIDRTMPDIEIKPIGGTHEYSTVEDTSTTSGTAATISGRFGVIAEADGADTGDEQAVTGAERAVGEAGDETESY